MIFPKFNNGHIIDKIREQYDPLALHVKPHVTLVFPFESNFETVELQEYLSAVLAETNPFELILSGVTLTGSGEYLFLNVQKGIFE